MSKKQWHESELFWETIQPILFGQEAIDSASSDVDALVELVGCRPGAVVLDLACGVGRHCLEFAKRGFKVTGVDRTGSYIEEARRRAADEGLEAEFVVGDMRDFRRDGAFDLAVCLFTSLGFFESREDDRRMIENVVRSLKPGGAFVVDVMGRETLQKVFCSRNWREEGGALLLEDSEVNDSWDTVDNHWIVIKNGDRREVRFSIHVYSSAELGSLLREGGLEVTGTYGWFDGSPYDDNAMRLVTVGRKPAAAGG